LYTCICRAIPFALTTVRLTYSIEITRPLCAPYVSLMVPYIVPLIVPLMKNRIVPLMVPLIKNKAVPLTVPRTCAHYFKRQNQNNI